MTLETVQLSKVGKTEKRTSKSPNSRKYSEVRAREYLLSAEIESMRSGVKKGKGRHAHRDSTLILLIYHHGLRVAEASALQWTQIDFNGGTIYVKRVKKGTPSVQPLYGDEIRSRSQVATRLSAQSLYFSVFAIWAVSS